jgi:VWFA-related protein
VVIFTDGQDTSSKLTLDEAARIALKSGVVVYSIGLGDPYYGGINEGLLRKISERTSGRAFFPEKVTEIQSAFAQIGEELLSQYLISYSSSNTKMDDKMRKIKIEIVNPELRKQGLQLSYQQGYFTRR